MLIFHIFGHIFNDIINYNKKRYCNPVKIKYKLNKKKKNL